MFMLVNKRPYYISWANGVKMWLLKEKKFTFVNRVIESHCRPIKAKWKNVIRVKFSFKKWLLKNFLIDMNENRGKGFHYGTIPANIYLFKVKNRELENGVKYVQS